MILGTNQKLLRQLDTMLDDALNGSFSAQSYDESLLSKIEAKMARFLSQSELRRDQIERERERMRSLISDISHQTKTPLANIALYTGLLAEQNLNEEQSELANQLTAGADKLNFLIQSLVKTSRLESGIIKIKPKPNDIGELLSSAVGECKSIAAVKGITLTIVGVANLTAVFDMRWCSEALFNIVENAVKYTPEGGSITVTVAEYEMFIRIDVTDTGRGIREEDLPKVFTRFWRVAESADTHGTGLGLYLAREIVTACGGYIKVVSKIGAGSTFSVFLSKV